MNEEVGVSGEEEEMIDSLFYRCDTHGEGKVHVYTVIQYLKNCLGNENNEPDLLGLSTILESDSTDGKITLSSYRHAVKQWVSRMRNRSESTSFLEPDGPLNCTQVHNLSNNSTDRSVCIETAGIGEGSFHRTEDDLGDLLQELEDLKFQHRKLGEDHTKLRNQFDAHEEMATNLTIELQNRNMEEEQLRKKMKSLQELVDRRQSVMDDNEELKTKLLSTQELKRDLDTKLVNFERENVNLENQARTYESKWQKACADLALVRKELQQLQNTCLEQEEVLFNAQEVRSSQDEALTQKTEELGAVKERLDQLMEQNEKLQEEKEDVQVKMAQTNGRLLWYQSKVEQLGLTDDSMIGKETTVDRSKFSPRLRFSTPLPKNSICMELKDRLNGDKNLPSPFCEKFELSHDIQDMNGRSALLPTYMSAWEFEISNGSLHDYSLDQLNSRRSLSPSLRDVDLEKKLCSLKGLEKDGLQKEIIKLYRTNLELAEKCHRAELKEVELHEVMSDTNHKFNLDKQKYLQLEESVETSRAARDVDLKDLWRLVHNPDEEDSTASECSLSVSTELLKDQIRQEIEALRNKLSKREKPLSSLKTEKSKLLQHSCKRRASNSPLVEALNIDFVRITRRHKFNDDTRTCGHCENHHEKCNRSVPLIRKYSKDECTPTQQPGVGDNKIGNSENLYNEESEIDKVGNFDNLDSGELDIKRAGNSVNLENGKTESDIDILDSSTDLEKMHRRDIPRRFKSESSADSENELSSSYNSMEEFSNSVGLRMRRSPKYSDKEYSEPNSSIHSAEIEFQKLHFVENLDSGQGIESSHPESFENSSDNLNSNRDEGYAMLRRKSYRKAIENQKHSFKDANNVKSRSNSCQSAIEQGHVSRTRSYATPYMRGNDSTPEYESSDSLLSNSSPRFSSTPLPISAVRSVHFDERSCDKTDPQCMDTMKMTKLRNTENEPELIEPVQAQLFKAGGLNPNKSPCTAHHLSILPEEDSNGHPGSRHSHSIISTHNLSSHQEEPSTDHSQGSRSERSSTSGFDCSAEVWTLSRSLESRTNPQCSTDSGHSSSITSFERGNMQGSVPQSSHGDQNSSITPPFLGSPVNHSTSISTSFPAHATSSLACTSLYNSSELPMCGESVKLFSKKSLDTPANMLFNTFRPSSHTGVSRSASVTKPTSYTGVSHSSSGAKSTGVFDIFKTVTDKANKRTTASNRTKSPKPCNQTGVSSPKPNSQAGDLSQIPSSQADASIPKPSSQAGALSPIPIAVTACVNASNGNACNGGPSCVNTFGRNSQSCVSNWNRDHLLYSSKTNNDYKCMPSPRQPDLIHSHQSERNFSPSERILQRSTANKLARKSENEHNDTNTVLVPLPNRITPKVTAVESLTHVSDEEKSQAGKELKVMLGLSLVDKIDDDTGRSHFNEPSSPPICFFKTGENGMKNPNTDQHKPAVINAVINNQGLDPGETTDQGDDHTFHVGPNLSKIREVSVYCMKQKYAIAVYDPCL